MITQTQTELNGLLIAAAEAAVATMASSTPLIAGEVTRDADTAPGSHHSALLAPFAGRRSGELLLVVDDELSTALQSAAAGPLDLAAALTPTVEAIAAALGPVTLGPVQVTEARLAVNRILAAAESGLVTLSGATGPRAAVAVALAPAPAAADVTGPPPADRLDLLRGVEMDATAELGRTRMTVNDLLALRSGAVVELDRIAGGPADLLVNGRLIARGEVVVVDENYGIRITQVVTDAAGR